MSKSFLPYGRQGIDEADIKAVTDVLRSDWLTTGPSVAAFETAFGDRVGAPHAAAVANGTAALHLAAMAAGLGPGDAAIVPSITFLATANCLRYVGAEVVFADVDAETGLMLPHHAEVALERAGDACVRAIFPVHLGGQVGDPEGIARLAKREGLLVIEDACHALGTSYEAGGEIFEVGACGHADLATFSFHPVKTIACGEGGMVTGRDPALLARIKRLRTHGMTRDAGEFADAALAFDGGEVNPWYYEMPDLGFNYRLSDIHSALGLSQLGRLDDLVSRRRTLVARYRAGLAALAPAVCPVPVTPGVDAGWHLFVVLIDFPRIGRSRGAVMRELNKRGIGTQVHYIPVHHQPYYRARYGDISLPGADAWYDRCLSLPLYAGMTEADVERCVAALADVCGL